MKKFSFKAKLWIWPGVGGWHFVNLPKDLAIKVRKVAKPYGSGFVAVSVTVGKSTWQTALFPHRESDTYLLSVKKSIRKKEEIFEDDDLKISFVLL